MSSVPATSTSSYDSDWSKAESLRDGRQVTIRSIRHSDGQFMQNELSHLSPDSIYHRFLTVKKSLSDQEVAYFTDVDSLMHVGMVAMIEEQGQPTLAGTGRYIVDPSDGKSAELAFEVMDEYQGQGIATALLRHLIAIARINGLHKFTALVLADNRKMLDVFSHSGLQFTQTLGSQGILKIELKLNQ
jgi:GNAT superfamily N-acetyltransferase